MTEQEHLGTRAFTVTDRQYHQIMAEIRKVAMTPYGAALELIRATDQFRLLYRCGWATHVDALRVIQLNDQYRRASGRS